VKFPKTQERNKLELISTDEAQIVLRRMKQQEAGENRVIRAEEMGGVWEMDRGKEECLCGFGGETWRKEATWNTQAHMVG